jgi:hypothetical protein
LIVRRFIAQALIAVTALLGLALLDLGPRACAGFVSAGAEQAGADLTDSTNPAPQVWPPKSPINGPIPLELLAHPSRSGDSGAGSSSSSSSTSSSSGGGMTSATEPPVPILVARLRALPDVFTPLLRLTSVFEPPRVPLCAT